MNPWTSSYGTEARRDCVQIQLILVTISRPPLLRDVLSRSQVNHVKVDSAVFRLHTNATVILLVTFSIAVTTRQYVGNPIDCVHTRWVWLSSAAVFGCFIKAQNNLCHCHLLFRKWLADLIICFAQRHSGRCAQHVLLDPLHVHGGGCIYKKAGIRGAIPGRGQLPEPGQCHYQAYEILSMGGVHAVFSGELWASLNFPFIYE